MRIPATEYLYDWICEECESGSKQKPPSSRLTEELPRVPNVTNPVKLPDSGKLHSKILRNGSWEKKVKGGKTKYIAANEAIKLSAGENKSFPSASVIRHSKPRKAEVGVKISERTAIKPRNVPPGSSAKEGLVLGHLPQPKPQRLGNMDIPYRVQQKYKKLSEVHQSLSGLKPSRAPMIVKEHMQEEQPRGVQTPQTKPGMLMKKTSSVPSHIASSSIISGVAGRTTELRTCNAENMNNNILPDLDTDSCFPGLDVLWNGKFSIKDEHRHGELNHQIRAHPPSNVRRNTYEFSKKMPELLDFQMVPLKDIWNNLFKEFSPDERDVGLYFFPSVRERSDGYISLLESITAKNMVLRKQIADVELLVFTSELLPVNCQYFEGKSFLWGVFRHLKRGTSSQPSDHVDDSKESDMDIDMIGGIEVGIKDVPVKREPFREKRVRFKEDSVTAAKMKMDINCLFPPGFEDIHRLGQARTSSTVAENSAGARQGKRREADDRNNGNRLRSFPPKVKSRYLQFS
ncbi:hypothetical protein CASFOL_015503 [Castilleja foliolosa]|uniref:AIPP2-like SPOC-like domain-containing protein n=1 Tax=Castilleja foliolosa TaxID=1961234 RepID=A0ABD3DDW9_9LAMI